VDHARLGHAMNFFNSLQGASLLPIAPLTLDTQTRRTHGRGVVCVRPGRGHPRGGRDKREGEENGFSAAAGHDADLSRSGSSRLG
jgi:hypothetical protein